MPRTRNHIALNLAATVLFAATLAGACSTRSTAPAAEASADQVARGRRLVSIGGCNDCHTPMKFDAELAMPVPDITRMLSGWT